MKLNENESRKTFKMPDQGWKATERCWLNTIQEVIKINTKDIYYPGRLPNGKLSGLGAVILIVAVCHTTRIDVDRKLLLLP